MLWGCGWFRRLRFICYRSRDTGHVRASICVSRATKLIHALSLPHGRPWPRPRLPSKAHLRRDDSERLYHRAKQAAQAALAWRHRGGITAVAAQCSITCLPHETI